MKKLSNYHDVERRIEQKKNLISACKRAAKDSYGLIARDSPTLKTFYGFFVVTDYIFGFVTDIDVALKKYSIDNVEIQPINSTTKMVKKTRNEDNTRRV